MTFGLRTVVESKSERSCNQRSHYLLVQHEPTLSRAGVSNPLLQASTEFALSLSSSSVYDDMAALGEEAGAVEPFNVVTEEQMRTGFVSVALLAIVRGQAFVPLCY